MKTAIIWGAFGALAVAIVASMGGCITVDQIKDALDKPDVPVVVDPVPDAPQPQPEPLPAPVVPEPPAVVASSEMQWFERDGRVVIRIDASRGPRGYSIVTAHGHKDIDPAPPMSEAQWLAANNSRPPHRIVDGYAEWALDRSGADIAATAQAYNRSSGPVVMLFVKCNTGGQVAYWVNPARQYGVEGGRDPVPNIDNNGWQVER
jgi:hypothetical protein